MAVTVSYAGGPLIYIGGAPAPVVVDSVSTSTGAPDAGKVPKLNAGGALDPTLLAPGTQGTRLKRTILSEAGDLDHNTMFGTFPNPYLSTHYVKNKLGGLIIGLTDQMGGVNYNIVKTRAATAADIPTSPALTVGYGILNFQFAAITDPGSMGHTGGFFHWIDADPTPGVTGEHSGRFDLLTTTGLHASAPDPARPLRFASRIAITVNRWQEMYLPGIYDAAPAVGTRYGGLFRLGRNGPGAGECVIKHSITSAVLMTTPEAGAHEVDANGAHWFTDVNALRSRVLTTADEPGCHVNLPVASGDYVTTGMGAPTSTIAAAADLVMTSLFYPRRDVPVVDIGVEVTTAVAGNLRIMIHADDGTGKPGALVANSGDISGATTGIKTWTGVNYTFKRDTRYWLSVHTAAAPSFRTSSANGATTIGYDGTSTGGSAHYIGRETTGQTYASGAPASVVGSRVTSFSRLPVLFSLKVA